MKTFKQYLRETYRENHQPPNVDLLEEVLEDVQGFDQISKTLNKHGFNWEQYDFPDRSMIIVTIHREKYLIADYDYPEPSSPSEFIYNLSEMELESLIPTPEDYDFWTDISSGYVVYHATRDEFKNNIIEQGLTPMNKTRGISNKWTPAAIFTSEEPEEIGAYGTIIFEIDVGAMKADGYTPPASREGPIEEVEKLESLASILGLEEMDFSDIYSSDGLSHSTVIFYGPIPPKYLEIV